MPTITYEIHPALGVARIGSSRDVGEDGFFCGPGLGEAPPEKYRDRAGDLKRQAARFRVFRCERDEGRRLLGATEITRPGRQEAEFPSASAPGAD